MKLIKQTTTSDLLFVLSALGMLFAGFGSAMGHGRVEAVGSTSGARNDVSGELDLTGAVRGGAGLRIALTTTSPTTVATIPVDAAINRKKGTGAQRVKTIGGGRPNALGAKDGGLPKDTGGVNTKKK